MSGVFVPMVAGKLIEDATKCKKTVRLASIATALAYETPYTVKEYQRRQEQKAKLAECQARD
jgi:hypothetical protein